VLVSLVPAVTPFLAAPGTVVRGVDQLVPPSLEISSVTFTIGVLAVTS
jgi:hypothetical protein